MLLPTTPIAVEAIANNTGLPVGLVRQIARRLRETGYLPDSGVGVPAAELTPTELSLLLIASLCGPFVQSACDTALRFQKIGTVAELASYIAAGRNSTPHLLELHIDANNVRSAVVDNGAFYEADGSRRADKSPGALFVFDKAEVDTAINNQMISTTVLKGKAVYAISELGETR